MKNNVLLVGILLVLAVSSYFVLSDKGTDNDTTRLLVPELQDQINEINGVVISKNDKQVSLSKKDGNWVVAEQQGFIADANNVANLLLELRKMTLKQKKTSNPENYHRLQLDESGVQAATNVVLKVDDIQLVEIAIGKKSQTGRGTYVRLNSDEQTWLASGSPNIKLESKDWIVTTILDIDSSLIKSVSYKSEDSDFKLSKSSPDEESFTLENTPDDKQIKSSANLSDYANGLQKFSISKVIDKTEFVKSDLSVQFEEFSGTQYTLEMTKVDEDYLMNLSLANAESIPEFVKKLQNWTYVIPSYKFDALNKKIDDLLEDKTEARADDNAES